MSGPETRKAYAQLEVQERAKAEAEKGRRNEEEAKLDADVGGGDEPAPVSFNELLRRGGRGG